MLPARDDDDDDDDIYILYLMTTYKLFAIYMQIFIFSFT